MIEFYYNPLSPITRRVWIALLEKQLEFEPRLVNLNGDQFEPDYLALNPFHHVPVIVDGNFRVLESIAILDYLEAKYPNPSLSPTDAETLAKVRMVQMVATNEIASHVLPLIVEAEDSTKLVKSKQAIDTGLKFFSETLGNSLYFGGDRLSVGDIVAGNSLILLTKLGIDLSKYSNLKDYCDRLMQREVWQKTQPNAEEMETFTRRVKALVKLHQRQQ
jgi:glutathione S-transferase